MNPRKNIKAKQRRRARMDRRGYWPSGGRKWYLKRDPSAIIEVQPGMYSNLIEIICKPKDTSPGASPEGLMIEDEYAVALRDMRAMGIDPDDFKTKTFQTTPNP